MLAGLRAWRARHHARDTSAPLGRQLGKRLFWRVYLTLLAALLLGTLALGVAWGIAFYLGWQPWLPRSFAQASSGWSLAFKLLRLMWMPLLIAAAVGIAVIPFVRRLTRRLEELDRGVTALGQGNLGARVAVRGHDEVARLAANFNHAAGQIEALVAAQRSLLANASHELRSPLARLRVGVALSAQSARPGYAADPATQAELARNIGELDQLIDEILLASRLDAKSAGGLPPLQLEEIDLTALVAEECAQLAPLAIELEVELIQVQGDVRLVQRMVRNLLLNAVRHGSAAAPEDGAVGVAQLSVRLSGQAHGFCVEVCDRGPGVPEALRERVFEPFYRVPGSRESDGSVGLGLSLVRQIAVLHGWQATCHPRAAGGACFRVGTAQAPSATNS